MKIMHINYSRHTTMPDPRIRRPIMDLPLPTFAVEMKKLTACENVLPSLPSLALLDKDLYLSRDDEEKKDVKPLKENIKENNPPPRKRKRIVLVESPENDPCIRKKTRPRQLRL